MVRRIPAPVFDSMHYPPTLCLFLPNVQICIALTVFREELSLKIVALFAALLFFKFFHVLIDERMNHVSVHDLHCFHRTSSELLRLQTT